jgi:hypothetical protein
VAELVCHKLRIDTRFSGQTSVGTAHDLKTGPPEFDFPELRFNRAPPDVVSAYGSDEGFGREDATFRRWPHNPLGEDFEMLIHLVKRG